MSVLVKTVGFQNIKPYDQASDLSDSKSKKQETSLSSSYIGCNALGDRSWVLIDPEKKEDRYITLLTGAGQVLTVYQGVAMAIAAEEGKREEVEYLLHKKQFTKEELAFAILFTEEEGHREIEELLCQGEYTVAADLEWAKQFILSIRKRGIQVVLAAQDRDIQALERFLEEGDITKKVRGAIVIDAAKKGHLDVMKCLLESGPILSRDRATAVEFAEKEEADCLCEYI